MMLAVLGADGREPSLRAWTIGLRRAGVPFTAVAMEDSEQRASFLAGFAAGGFQALIVADGEILDRMQGTAEGNLLQAAERRFGTRRLIAYSSPTAQRGLGPAGTAGSLDGMTTRLTENGRGVFPYLRGEVQMDPGSWAQGALPRRGQSFDPLLIDPGGAVLLGIHRLRDGREEMVQTFAVNAHQSQAQLLRPGQIRWLTGGLHLGCERVYLPIHVDDVLLPNHAWDLTRHATDDSPAAGRRMTAQDGSRAIEWARSQGLRLDLVCNGSGSDRHAAASESGSDELLDVLRAGRDAVRWVNHTYSHLLLYDSGAADIDEQIDLNLDWARRAGVELEPDALVTGAHSGLGDLSVTPPQAVNPTLVAAIEARGIRFVGCDASRAYPTGHDGREAPAGELFRVGGAVAVPRHPLPLPYDAVSSDEALDRLRHDGEGEDVGWGSIVARQSARVLAMMLSNDPRPHFCHQSNLIEAGGRTLLTCLLDAVCERYRGTVAANMPILQPTMGESGRLLERDITWRDAVEDGSLRVFTDGTTVRIENGGDAEVSVPLTGTTAGELYAGARSGWLTVSPGTTVVPGDHGGPTGKRRR
jgi:hypothetical protein